MILIKERVVFFIRQKFKYFLIYHDVIWQVEKRYMDQPGYHKVVQSENL